MAITARELVVKVGFKTDGQGLKKTEDGLQKLGRVAKVVGTAFATGVVARGFKQLADLGSAAAERQNKFAAIFEGASASTQQALEETARRTGIATGALQGYAAQIGAVVKPALGNAEAAGAMSARISELALDIASFNDLEPEVALEKLRSGLLGSTEPLDAVGVNLRANNIGLKEYAERVGKTTAEVTQGEKVQLRYNAILKQLEVQGALRDATKTSKGFANASRALQTQIKELGEQIGTEFLPTAGRMVQGTLKLVMAIQEWVKANRGLIRSGVLSFFRVFNGLVKALQNPLGMIGAAVIAIAVAMAKMGVVGFLAWLKAFAPALLVIGLLGLIGAAIFLVIDDLETMGEGGESVIGTLIEGFNGLVEELGSLPAAIQEFLQTAFDFWVEFFGDMFGVSDETLEGIKGAFSALSKFIINSFNAVFGVVSDLFGGVGKVFSGDFKGALKDVENAATRAGGVFLDFVDKVSGDSILGGNVQETIAAGIEAERQSGAISRSLGAAQEATSTARPSPTARAAGAGGNAQISTQATINVNAQPGQDPREIGRGAMNRADELRSRDERRAAKFAFAPGGAT